MDESERVSYRDEDRKTLKAGDAWETVGAIFGWTLHGWTFDDRATFWITENTTAQVTKKMREDIEAALAAAFAGEV